MNSNILNQKHSDEDRDNGLSKYLLVATGAHIALVILLFIFQVIGGFNFFTSKDKKTLKVIQSAVRVDIVGMPKFTVQELKKMKVSAAATSNDKINNNQIKTPKPLDVDKNELNFKKIDKKIGKTDKKVDEKKIDLNKLLKNMSNKKVSKTKSKINNIDRKALRSLVLEGNKVSKGAALVGDSIGTEQTLFNQYISGLPNFVRPHWRLPSYLMGRELKCRVRIFIAANGKILKAQIFESSGVIEFDKKALRAINMSNPLPRPENEILARVSAGEVILGFPL